MLFNSYAFIFGFLPLALLGYELAARFHRRAVVAWLALASLAFYAYWRPAFLLLLGASITFNYGAAWLITARRASGKKTRWVLWAAIAMNLGALCYYKYLFPMLHWFTGVFHGSTKWGDVLLPLGISFFTFTQIAYLVDLQEGSAERQDFSSYVLFVSFFPHLIAGPILHHGEMMPQFQRDRDYRLKLEDLAVGFSWFVMGLFKKVVIADRFAVPADRAFSDVAGLGFSSAWAGVLAYALQLYFDFSGYSDMALGLARMFSIDFPLNFSSPYKATSVIDFWQRWHITLTRYITVYIYNPSSLWINRRRMARGLKISPKALATPAGFTDMVVVPTMITLLLAGIWHGAGLQFAIFGLLHAIYLCTNHAWRIFRKPSAVPRPRRMPERWLTTGASVLLTFVCVLIAQVFFRANSTHDAVVMLGGMSGYSFASQQGGNGLPAATLSQWAQLAVGFFIVWTLPNTQQILSRYKPSLQLLRFDMQSGPVNLTWRPDPLWAAVLGVALFAALARVQNPSTFLYFQF
jgi:alginate O-acetyltransferase complex protein AlgI